MYFHNHQDRHKQFVSKNVYSVFAYLPYCVRYPVRALSSDLAISGGSVTVASWSMAMLHAV